MISSVYFSKQRELLRYLKAGDGCRVGEAAVCSRKVHLVDPYRPEFVTVVKNADAGQVFYKRQKTGEIIHVDIFHAVGRLRPQPIAEAVKRGLERYALHGSVERGYEQAKELHQLAHFFDVQTGLGGGRVTGSQLFGQKESVKKAHLNHVHLSGKLANGDLAAVFFIVAAVERAIIEQGLELRRIEFLQHEENQFRSQYEDLSPYTAFTDTFLRESPVVGEDQAYGYELAMIADLMENLNDLQELGQILKEVQRAGRMPNYGFRDHRFQDTWIKVEGYGLVTRQGYRYRLTEAGMELSRRLLVNAREIEAGLRQQSILWARQAGDSSGSFGTTYKDSTVRRGLARPKVVELSGDFLAVSATVTNALTRRVIQNTSDWAIKPQDLRFEQRQARRGIDICLLLDASASMLGKRMTAAKNLAEHLVQNSRDRISVITFQEQAVNVVVPFTRNRLLIKQSLATIKPGGLTPLAAGLRKATDHVRSQCRRPGLLILVTDGIPTLGEKAVDPLQDALIAARDFRNQTSFHLCCIGLQPNHSILRKVAKEAAGSLYIIDELNTASLVQIASSERSRSG
ncbi:MAG: VWA domain-containing protein [Firmicutes bacterium]|nr:VWA domain-containing protein [Bacillota bacterium]